MASAPPNPNDPAPSSSSSVVPSAELTSGASAQSQRSRDADLSAGRDPVLIYDIITYASLAYKSKVKNLLASPYWNPVLDSFPRNVPQPDFARATVYEVRQAFLGQCAQKDLQAAIDQWVDDNFPDFSDEVRLSVKKGACRTSPRWS